MHILYLQIYSLRIKMFGLTIGVLDEGRARGVLRLGKLCPHFDYLTTTEVETKARFILARHC